MVFRSIVGRWLQNVAGQKLREAVVQTAQEQLSAAAKPAEQAPAPCDVGMVFALEIEAGGTEDLLGDVVTTQGQELKFRQGRLREKRVVLVLAGPGRKQAARAAEALIDGHRPRRVISAGFGGGLDPSLNRYDIFLAEEVLDATGGAAAVDLAAIPEGLRAGPQVRAGRLLTVDQVVRLPDERRRLLAEHGAAAVDMETSAVAEVCRRREVPFLAVRVINDTAGDVLPPDVQRLLAQKSSAARWGAAVAAVWERPGSIKDLYQLKENALVASDRLAKFLAPLIVRW